MTKCETHPDYQAKRRPKAACGKCWIQWLEANPDEPLVASDLLSILPLLRVVDRVVDKTMKPVERVEVTG